MPDTHRAMNTLQHLALKLVYKRRVYQSARRVASEGKMGTHHRSRPISVAARRGIAVFVAVTVTGLSTVAMATSQPPVQPKQTVPAKQFVKALHDQMHRLTDSHKQLGALHEAIGSQLVAQVDFAYMGQRILGTKTFSSLKPAQRIEFLALLQKMLVRTYVKRFKPGNAIEVKYADKVRTGKKGRVQVRTEISVNRMRADVWYALIGSPTTGWRIFDIVVDEASQLRTYRRSFRRVLKKDGWDGLMTRMKKSANRK
jgi:phospholipid transport system substrate-binding protein